jgi:hypothetical protein
MKRKARRQSDKTGVENDPNPAVHKKGKEKRKNYLGKEAAKALEEVSNLCPSASLSYTRMNMCDTHLSRDESSYPNFFSLFMSSFCGETVAPLVPRAGKSKMPRTGKLVLRVSSFFLRTWCHSFRL